MLDVQTPLLYALGLELFKDELKEARDQLRSRALDEPMETTVQAVLVAASLFYAAEHGHNPKVDSFAAALEYISSSLNVGYTPTFPVTQAGKLIATVVMTYGPALAAHLLEPTRAERERAEAKRDALDVAMLTRLDAILEELRAS